METTTVSHAHSLGHRLLQGHKDGQPRGLGTSLNPKPSTSRNLRRQWTTCKFRPGPTAVTGALPFPFMEISVSVVDTLDMLRSSVEEEIVFQATMQVPAHHAMACRIEAYDSPFASAPALKAEPYQLTEADRQFAACLASPPDIEEVHTINISRVSAFGQQQQQQQQAPVLRAASGGLLTVSFSVRQRQSSSSRKQDGDTGEEPDLHTPQDEQQQQQDSTRPQQQGSLLKLQRTSSISRSGSSFTQQLGPWGETPRGHSTATGLGARQTIAEQEESVDVAGEQEQDEEFNRALSNIQRHGMVRLSSFSAGGRQQAEVPLAVPPGSRAFASLLGFSYLIMHAWQARTEPAKGLMKAHINAMVGVAPSTHKFTVKATGQHANQLL